jgi:hypothetical protein
LDDQAVKVTRDRIVIEIADGAPVIPKAVWSAIDQRLDALPQPERHTERDRWRMISREAVHVALPVLAAITEAEHGAGEIPPELAGRVLKQLQRLGAHVPDDAIPSILPYLARIAGRQL